MTVPGPATHAPDARGEWQYFSVTHDDRAVGDGVVIERLRDADVERARTTFTMMHEMFDEEPAPLSDRYLADLLADTAFWAIGAFDAGEPVGAITAHALPMTRHERTELFIYDLAVRDDQQRRGIGRRLVEALIAEAAGQGIDVVFVPADDDDLHAVSFYESLGGRGSPVTIFDLGAR